MPLPAKLPSALLFPTGFGLPARLLLSQMLVGALLAFAFYFLFSADWALFALFGAATGVLADLAMFAAAHLSRSPAAVVVGLMLRWAVIAAALVLAAYSLPLDGVMVVVGTLVGGRLLAGILASNAPTALPGRAG